MSTVADLIDDYYPASEDVGVPLRSDIWILFDREMDEDQLEEDIFVEGPDTDTYVGPGFEIQVDPDNISEGDDLLTSPGMKGIVQGTYEFKKIHMTDSSIEVEESPYRTKLIFSPSRTLAALTEYTLHIPEIKDADGTTYEGYYTASWTTGSGSIQALPSSASTSVLSTLPSSTDEELEVSLTTPADHAIEVSTDTKTITVKFDKPLDPNSITSDKITVTTLAASDHPNAPKTAVGELVKSLEVDGVNLIIRI